MHCRWVIFVCVCVFAMRRVRNDVLTQHSGAAAVPRMKKTGTTIVGVVFKVVMCFPWSRVFWEKGSSL